MFLYISIGDSTKGRRNIEDRKNTNKENGYIENEKNTKSEKNIETEESWILESREYVDGKEGRGIKALVIKQVQSQYLSRSFLKFFRIDIAE